ncbi:unnamed protein product [marine sediment metagenome]|uniref:Uncharacterized protein n=1 Tax=marine sediment metagenome TaxID=412755 RepID=X1IC64_9ZZZZ
MRITEVVATHLSIPLKDRFWMSLSPIGGMQPKVDKLLLEIRTDAGISARCPETHPCPVVPSQRSHGRATGARAARRLDSIIRGDGS